MAIDIQSMSCTKMRNLLEEKRVAWLADNITLSDLQIIKRKLYRCSKEAYANMSRLFSFLDQKIGRQ